MLSAGRIFTGTSFNKILECTASVKALTALSSPLSTLYNRLPVFTLQSFKVIITDSPRTFVNLLLSSP